MISKRCSAGLLTVLAGLMVCTSAMAVPIISNLPGNDGSASTIAASTGNFAKAAGFTMGASNFSLDSVTLRLRVNDPAATLTVQLFSDAGGAPVGLALVDFTNPVLPAGMSSFVFVPTAAFLLDAGTTYWVAATGLSPTSDGIEWLASAPGVAPTGLATSAGYTFSSAGVYPPTNGSSIFNSYQVDGTAVVAEPTTLVLSALGLAALGFRRRRVTR